MLRIKTIIKEKYKIIKVTNRYRVTILINNYKMHCQNSATVLGNPLSFANGFGIGFLLHHDTVVTPTAKYLHA